MKLFRIFFILIVVAVVGGCSHPTPTPEAVAPAPVAAPDDDTVICAPHQSPMLPGRLKMKLFDTAVNTGISRAVKLLQQSINAISPTARLAVDGRIGPRTRAALCGLSEGAILEAYVQAQGDFYRGIVQRKPSQVKFLRGWLRRAEWLPE